MQTLEETSQEYPENEQPHPSRRNRKAMAPLNIAEMEASPREALIAIATELGVEGAGTLRKPDLI
ncbi:MAG: Rho termination factor N-terminal domain-containing protein, partial [Tepidiformaceae bacterium]